MSPVLSHFRALDALVTSPAKRSRATDSTLCYLDQGGLHASPAKRAKPSESYGVSAPIDAAAHLADAAIPAIFDLGIDDALLSEFKMLVTPPDDHVDELLWQLVAPAASPGFEDFDSLPAAFSSYMDSPHPSTSADSDSEGDGLAIDFEGFDSTSLRHTPCNPMPKPIEQANTDGEAVADLPLTSRIMPVGSVQSRKEWLPWEDEAIRAGVSELGTKWRAISTRLPGRSDDAVRNRWARLQLIDSSSAAGGSASARGGAKPTSARPKRTNSEPRHSWTHEEDLEIIRSVAENGRRWNRIAERLQGRTEHAIRNRWHRLQMAAIDEGRTVGAPFPELEAALVGRVTPEVS